MSSNLIGIVTFGGLNFTKLTIQGIRETVKSPYLIYAVVGKPGDQETITWLNQENIPFVWHELNWGFPYSVNDIYDFAWKRNSFDNLIMIGNDVIPYPHAVDSLIQVANTTDFEWICSRQYSVKDLVRDFPETKGYFSGEKMTYNFQDEPWKVYQNYSNEISISSAGLSDVHNLALYKKSVMDKIGYIDVNFYPAYYEDNDYARRGVNAKIRSCTVINSIYFHFWSRTIHQGTGGSDSTYFNHNRNFYLGKWGGDFGKEKYTIPFNEKPFDIGNGTILNYGLNIQSRDQEKEIISFWMEEHG